MTPSCKESSPGIDQFPSVSLNSEVVAVLKERTMFLYSWSVATCINMSPVQEILPSQNRVGVVFPDRLSPVRFQTECPSVGER